MADDKPTSGNRWEPGLDDETAPIAGPDDAPGQGPQWDEHGDRHGGPGQGFGREGDAADDSGTGGDGA